MTEYRDVPGKKGYVIDSDRNVWSRWAMVGRRMTQEWRLLEPFRRPSDGNMAVGMKGRRMRVDHLYAAAFGG